MRSDISFKTTDGLTLKGWLYLTGDATAYHPAIVMAHGFTAVKEQYLDRYVELFAKHGFAVLVYDNGNFGTSEDPKSDCALLDQGCFDYFIDSPKSVAPKSIELLSEYESAYAIDRISPTPLQIIVAQKDTVTVSDFALKSYEWALQPKHLVPLDCGHFDPYLSQFEASSTAAVEWFKRHL